MTRLLTLLVALVGITLSIGSTVLSAQPATLLLDWAPNTNHTGIYVALEKGWYEAEGLDLQILEPGGNVSAEAVVGAGRVDFAVSFQEWVTHARLADIPVVSIAAVIQHNTSGFASLSSKGITRPADFEGRLYGGWGTPMEEAILRALMEADGADYDKLQRVNVNATDLLTLISRDVDLAWIYYGWQGIEARLRGMDIHMVMMNDYPEAVPNYYTPVLITSEALIVDQSEFVRGFVHATARGYEYAIAHPDEAAAILLRHAPENDPELVRRSQRWLSPRYTAGAPQWGWQEKRVWQRFGDWMLEQGLIERRFDGAAAFTNAFLPPVGS